MSDFRERIEKLSPKRLMLLAMELQSRVEAMEREQSEPIAIVGIGCRMPQAGRGTRPFWNLLSAGTDAVTQVPRDRWDASAWYDPDPDSPGHISTTWGSFLSDVDRFDAPFFNISAREAASMDPQHRLLLESCWEALEHAGRSPRSLLGSSTGLFVGLTNNDYHGLLFDRSEDTLDTYVATGVSPSVAAGRIAYALGLHGPCITLDTACSASLVAVHLACRSLRSGECGLALAAGVNLILSPDVTVALSRAHMMAPDGRSKSFDARANGFVRGEGCGVVVLKRLSEAEAAGDRILAVIRGTAVNQDGRSSGLTAPNGAAQEALLRAALADARLSASDIDYIEAHGTGTSLGDPIEAHALAAVFGPGRTRPLVVGSVKTNIGHLEAAAGIAGLIKTVLALEQGQIPRHLHFRSMNPHIDWGSLQVEIPTAGRAWPRGERVRRAGISSFGFSGTNAHVIVEEAPPTKRSAAEQQPGLHLLPLSARTPAALEEMRASYREHLSGTTAEAEDICYTASAGRAHFEERTFCLGKDRAALQAALEQPALRGRKEATPAVAFLFSGQGAQYAGMGRALYEAQPVFREAIDRCATLLQSELEVPLTEVLWGSRTDLLGQTRYTQPGLFALEWALAQLWQSWGVRPSVVAGHSVGEYVAAVVAEVMPLEAGLRLIAARGRLMQNCAGRGVMTALRAGEQQVSPLLRGYESRVSLAALNAPESVVIAGYEAEVEQVEERLRTAGIEVKRLTVSHGFHSPQMEEMEAEFESVAGHFTYSAPAVQWISGLTGATIGSASVDAPYWRRQVRQPVQWARAMAAMEQLGTAVYLEIGPGTTLLGLGRQCLEPAERVWLPSLRSSRPDPEQMLDSLGRLYLAGLDPDWDAFHRPFLPRPTSLPTYPFESRHYWADVTPRQPRIPASEPPPDWFYQISWLPKPAAEYAGPATHGPAADFDSLTSAAAEFRMETGFHHYDDLHPLLARVSVDFIVRALRRLGWTLTPGAEFAPGDLARTLGIAPQHLRLFSRLLDVLAEDGILRQEAARWVILRDPSGSEPEPECRALASRFPPFRAEIEMLRNCGDALDQVLSGRTDPLRLLFSEGSFESAEQLYTQSPGLRVFNSLAASAVAQEVRRRPGRKLRVLEIGAGTGATTAWIAPVLPADRTDYCYTDISAAFLGRAKTKFAQYSFFDYRTLDIERDPASQGFPSGQFDIIVAANVLHATTDLRTTMRHVRALLAPSGIALMVEGIRPEAWVDLTFGLTEGWWRFRDHDLRPSYPLISQASWMSLLSETGFCAAGAVRAGDSQVAVIVARAPHAEIPQRWLIIPDRSGIADEFSSLLAALGGNPRLAPIHEALALLGAEHFHGVLHLGALDAPSNGAITAPVAGNFITTANSEILHLAQTCIENNQRLWLATCGAQPVLEGEGDLAVAQAPVWGWAKTISLEQPQCGGGVIDLDPSVAPRENAIALADAVLASGIDDEDQLALRNGTRFVPRLQRAPAPAPPILPLANDKVYLITGGLGGLGLRLARWMAQRGARRLLLVGRSALPDRSTWDSIPADSSVGRQIAALREIEYFGAEVTIRAVDICDERQTADLLASVPDLGGIFHLAAAGQMSSLPGMTSADMREVMAPKILGTWNLHQLSKDRPLDFFILFSSWASVLGAQGLGHYNAANQFIDSMAHNRRSLGLPATTLNWGRWEVLRNASEDLVREYDRSGLKSMACDAALTAMMRAASSGAPQTIIADVDWQNLKALYEVRRPRPILEFASNQPVTSPVPPSTTHPSFVQPEIEEALTEPQPPHADIRAEILAAPVGERARRIESYLSAVLASVISTPAEQLPPETATDQLGLDSLMALEARNRINSELEINLTAGRFLQGFTIAELAAKIVTELPEPGAASVEDSQSAAPATGPADDSFALSFAQRAYWVVQRVVPDSSTLNCAFTAKASPFLQFEVFQRAVWKLMERHPALRTVIFEAEDGEPRQRIRSSWQAETTLIDATAIAERDLVDIANQEFQRAFDVRESMFRIPVFRRSDCDILVFVFHHMVVDGTSMPLCLSELREIYAAELNGSPLRLPPVQASQRDFVQWEAELVHGPGFDRLWNYWKQELSGDLPVLSLPLSRPRPAVFLPRAERIMLDFGPDLVRNIHDTARQLKTTTFSFLLAPFQILLCSVSGQDDLLVGTSSSTRDLAKWENTVGCLVNLFPIRSRLSRHATFAEHLARTRKTILDALDHQGIPFTLLVEKLRIRRDFGCPPLFQSFFNFLTERRGNLGRFLLGMQDAAIPFGNSMLHPWTDLRNDETQSDVMMYLADFGEEMYGYLTYNVDVVDQSVAQHLAADYVSLVRAVAANPDILISQLPIASFEKHETEPEELLL